jgi:DnaJ-class molecular chaperone
MEPTDSAQTCRGCHAEHHANGRSCATCHRTERITAAHAPPVQAHLACNACHPTAAIAPLTPTRSFCLVCHGPGVDHHPERECVACHLLATPEEYRPRLLK